MKNLIKYILVNLNNTGGINKTWSGNNTTHRKILNMRFLRKWSKTYICPILVL